MLQHDFFQDIIRTIFVPISFKLLRLLRRSYSTTGFVVLAICTSGLIILPGLILSTQSSSTASQSARQSDSVADFVGINLHLGYPGTPYIDHFDDWVVPLITELGVRHARDSNEPGNTDKNNRILTLSRKGVKFMLQQNFTGGAHIDVAARDNIKLLNSDPSKPVEVIEGPNEYDCSGTNTYDFKWIPALDGAVKAVWNLYKSDPATSGITIAGPSWCNNAVSAAAFVQADSQIGNYIDIPNSHPGSGGTYPEGPLGGDYGQSFDTLLPRYESVKPGHSLIGGEIGFTMDRVSERAAAKYLPRQILWQLSRGVLRDLIYQLLPAQENYHIVNADGTPRQQFYSLKNLISIFKDQGTAFVPGSLDYSFSGDMSNVNQMLFQKRNGTFLLAIWQGVSSFENQHDIEPQPKQVTLRLGTPSARANLYLPLNSASPFSTIQNASSIDLSVPDHILVVEITTGTVVPRAGAVRISAGNSQAYRSNNGTIWSADQYFIGGQTFGVGSISISGTSDQSLYQNERYGMTGYDIPVANGSYTVNLGFTETFSGVNSAGQRVFDFSVQGTTFSNFDIFAQAGGRNIALQKSVTVQVSNGMLNIGFTKKKGDPKIDSIEVIPTN